MNRPASSAVDEAQVGYVIIGRNEGARLELCLRSVLAHSTRAVYADSHSCDGSADLARRLGVTTVVLDASAPMTAARGRNAGFARLRERFPECEFVQFIDGDCVLLPGWIGAAASFLERHADAAVVCGRRLEAAAETSFYNGLMDREWDTPAGIAEACGGDALVRITAFEQVQGFGSSLTAGEEPELCARLRAAGWTIWRLDHPMTEHDANIHRLRQWWKRAKRSGYGYAQVWTVTKSLPRRLYGRKLASALFWTTVLPAVVATAAVLAESLSMLMLIPLLYLAQSLRIALASRLKAGAALRYGALMMITKFAEAIGIATYLFSGKEAGDYDYKAAKTSLAKLKTP